MKKLVPNQLTLKLNHILKKIILHKSLSVIECFIFG
jgi:hypothetical protein